MAELDPLGEPNPLWDWATDSATSFGLGPTADLANCIGRVIVGYSAIEFQLYTIYAVIAKQNAEESFLRFYSARNINGKQNLVFDEISALPPEYISALKTLWRTMRGAASRRVEVAHCAIGRNGDRVTSLRLNGKRPFRTNVDINLFIRTIRQFRTLQTDAHIFLVYLRLLDPELWHQRLDELPVPRRNDNPNSNNTDPGNLPPHVEAEKNASLKRLGLDTVIVVPNIPYPRPVGYRLSYHGRSVVWMD
ncbi:MAG: hypothetical protein ACRYGC_02485 [Janthinobacterium lividum]